MTYQIIIDIGNMLFSLFGNGYILTLLITGVLFFMLLSVKAPTGVYFIVLLPMLLGFAVNIQQSDFIAIAPWIFYVALILLGITFGMIFLVNLLGR